MVTAARKRLGEGDACPFCSATSGVVEDPDGHSCIVCGAPRILVDPPPPRKGTERAALERARDLRRRRAAWGVAAGIATALSALGLLGGGLIAALTDLGVGANLTLMVVTLLPVLFALFGWQRTRSAGAGVRAAIEEARTAVGRELVSTRRLDGPELARLLHVTPERAERILAEAQVEQFLAEGGDSPGAARRFRVAPETPEAPAGESPTAARRDRSDR